MPSDISGVPWGVGMHPTPSCHADQEGGTPVDSNVDAASYHVTMGIGFLIFFFFFLFLSGLHAQHRAPGA